MTDQTIPADKVRDLRDQYENLIEATGTKEAQAYYRYVVKDLDALLPPPPLPTLADMTDDERRACQWMQCDTVHAGRGVILQSEDEDTFGPGAALVLFKGGTTCGHSHHLVTPLPDLPRMTWPGAAPTDEVVTEEFGIEYETPQIHRGVWDGWFFTEQEARRALQEYPPEWSPRLVRRRVSAPETVR